MIYVSVLLLLEFDHLEYFIKNCHKLETLFFFFFWGTVFSCPLNKELWVASLGHVFNMKAKIASNLAPLWSCLQGFVPWCNTLSFIKHLLLWLGASYHVLQSPGRGSRYWGRVSSWEKELSPTLFREQTPANHSTEVDNGPQTKKRMNPLPWSVD